MALSREQQAFRARRLGSSDALRLMAGNWGELWAEKTGRLPAPSLDFVAYVQIGIVTEPLHARFFTHRTGIPCRPAEETLVHPQFDFICAHLDFLTWREAADAGERPADTLIEAKFTTGFDSDGELATRYYWQVQHQLLVSGLEHAVLSILRPTAYSLMPVTRQERDIATLTDTLHAFWWYVENDVEPADMEPVAAPVPPGTRILDMARHNEFAALAGTLVETQPAVQSHRDAERALKSLLPEDAQIAFVADGAQEGVMVQRRKDGRLALRIGEVPRRHRQRAELWEPAGP
jgi:predicted phage-related endonuclease